MAVNWFVLGNKLFLIILLYHGTYKAIFYFSSERLAILMNNLNLVLYNIDTKQCKSF